MSKSKGKGSSFVFRGSNTPTDVLISLYVARPKNVAIRRELRRRFRNLSDDELLSVHEAHPDDVHICRELRRRSRYLADDKLLSVYEAHPDDFQIRSAVVRRPLLLSNEELMALYEAHPNNVELRNLMRLRCDDLPKDDDVADSAVQRRSRLSNNELLSFYEAHPENIEIRSAVRRRSRALSEPELQSLIPRFLGILEIYVEWLDRTEPRVICESSRRMAALLERPDLLPNDFRKREANFRNETRFPHYNPLASSQVQGGNLGFRSISCLLDRSWRFLRGNNQSGARAAPSTRRTSVTAVGSPKASSSQHGALSMDNSTVPRSPSWFSLFRGRYVGRNGGPSNLSGLSSNPHHSVSTSYLQTGRSSKMNSGLSNKTSQPEPAQRFQGGTTVASPINATSLRQNKSSTHTSHTHQSNDNSRPTFLQSRRQRPPLNRRAPYKRNRSTLAIGEPSSYAESASEVHPLVAAPRSPHVRPLAHPQVSLESQINPGLLGSNQSRNTTRQTVSHNHDALESGFHAAKRRRVCEGQGDASPASSATLDRVEDVNIEMRDSYNFEDVERLPLLNQSQQNTSSYEIDNFEHTEDIDTVNNSIQPTANLESGTASLLTPVLSYPHTFENNPYIGRHEIQHAQSARDALAELQQQFSTPFPALNPNFPPLPPPALSLTRTPVQQEPDSESAPTVDVRSTVPPQQPQNPTPPHPEHQEGIPPITSAPLDQTTTNASPVQLRQFVHQADQHLGVIGYNIWTGDGHYPSPLMQGERYFGSLGIGTVEEGILEGDEWTPRRRGRGNERVSIAGRSVTPYPNRTEAGAREASRLGRWRERARIWLERRRRED
ncbi:hypothetical protein EG329_000536 [Mollisiaceae sp. DMI_Dod_QoI]|nr:hypothetical protein EG329_000536 [Helotiales sp. DMI_Dod_QoI]